EPKDQFYGDRSGTLKDPFGQVWFLATHQEDLTEAQIRERAQAMFVQG
ncbi:VOC family protein, partial [Pseudomonas gingeri]|nr:VOC family protein [Pseudomonas gingeri]